jgi:hypothetical protein
MQVLERSDTPPWESRPGSSPAAAGSAFGGAPARPQAPGPAQLIDALLNVHRQDRFAGVLTATAQGATKLGLPSFVGCMLRDPGTGAWHLTALFDPASRPMQLAQAGMPLNPFTFSPPATVAARPLADLLGQAWGMDQCAQVERRLGVTTALCAPIRDAGGTRGALVAFPTTSGQMLLLAGLLVHAGTAAVRLVDHELAPATDGVLDPLSFAERAGHELARALRYQREMTLVVFEPNSLSELARIGPALVRTLRKWDLLGRIEADRPVLAAVLPETGRNGGHGLVRRLGKFLDGIQVGAASFPEDGGNLDTLIEAARARVAGPGDTASLATGVAAPAGRGRGDAKGMMRYAEVKTVWVRGAPAGPGFDSVRCPRCMASYTRTGDPIPDNSVIERALVAARAVLHADCPQHMNRIAVTA